MIKTRILVAVSCTLLALVSCATIPPFPETDIYDNFGNAKYDRKIDGTKWSKSKNAFPLVAQQAGKLTFSMKEKADHDDETRLFSKVSLPMGSVRYFGAKLSLEPPSNSVFYHVAVNLQRPELSGSEFWIEADLMGQGPNPALLCKIGYFGTNNREEYSFTYDNGLEYGKEYSVRIDLDSDSGLVRWSLDGTTIAEIVSKELIANKDQRCKFVINSLRTTGSDAVSTADDAILFWQL